MGMGMALEWEEEGKQTGTIGEGSELLEFFDLPESTAVAVDLVEVPFSEGFLIMDASSGNRRMAMSSLLSFLIFPIHSWAAATLPSFSEIESNDLLRGEFPEEWESVEVGLGWDGLIRESFFRATVLVDAGASTSLMEIGFGFLKSLEEAELAPLPGAPARAAILEFAEKVNRVENHCRKTT